ncbi:MAG: hypothetical protein F6K17_11370 [Okeania sp. SIO3C4]|nr:hypothetical protein [Okeania sp. SIO3C4]
MNTYTLEEGRQKAEGKERFKGRRFFITTGLTQINLKHAICRGEWHSPSLDLVPVRKSCTNYPDMI